MIKITKISGIVLLGLGLTTIQAKQMQKYEVKSAKIEYELKGSSDIMGMVTVKSIGKKRVLIDNYGEREIVEVSKIKKANGKVSKTHTFRYINGTTAYGVDFEKNFIHRNTNYMGDTFGLGSDEKTLKKYHKKIGTDTVAGKPCDIWRFATSMTGCIYKGLPLRSTINGKVVEIATKVEIDVDLSIEDFRLPDFPVDIGNGERPRKYTQSELEEIDTKMKEKSKVAENEEENFKKLWAEAYAKAGVKNNRPTEDQLKKVRKYMEPAMLAKEKREVMEKAKKIPKLKACFENANSVKESNICEVMKDSDDPDLRYEWNDKIKSKILKRMSMIEKSVPCVNKAESIKALEQCFPE